MANLNKTVADRTPVVALPSGGLQGAYFEYEASGAAIGDVIYMGRCPQGARFVRAKLFFDDLGSGVTADLGYTTADNNGDLVADDNYFLDDEDVATAAGSATWEDWPFKLDEPVYLILTIAGGAATGTIGVLAEYIYEDYSA